MIVIFIFHFVDVMYYIYSFAYVEPSLYPRDKSLFVMVYNIFNVVLYLVSWYFVDNLCTYVHQVY